MAQNFKSPEDEELYRKHRAAMRSAYVNALGEIVGTRAWDHNADRMLDVMDWEIQSLMKAGGRVVPNVPELEGASPASYPQPEDAN